MPGTSDKHRQVISNMIAVLGRRNDRGTQRMGLHGYWSTQFVLLAVKFHRSIVFNQDTAFLAIYIVGTIGMLRLDVTRLIREKSLSVQSGGSVVCSLHQIGSMQSRRRL